MISLAALAHSLVAAVPVVGAEVADLSNGNPGLSALVGGVVGGAVAGWTAGIKKRRTETREEIRDVAGDLIRDHAFACRGGGLVPAPAGASRLDAQGYPVGP